MKKYLNLDKVLDIANYQQSLIRWSKLYQNCKKTQSQNFYTLNFNKYIEIIKPLIYPYSIMAQISKHQHIQLYTTQFTEEQLKRLMQIYRPLQKIKISKELPNPNQIIEQVGQYFSTSVRQPIYKINLKQSPKNQELKYWNSTLPVQNIKIQGLVIRGKGVGAKQLGMPTANIEVTNQINQKLIEYPNGIYVVKFRFIYGQTYNGVMSLGINPHYENSIFSRKLEVYVFNEFEKDFYDVEVQVDVRKLIRFQGKFMSFDSFLNAMHNDIQVGKNCTI